MKRNKSDMDLGLRVHKHLLKVGLETPMKGRSLPETKKERISHLFRNLMEVLNLDMQDDSLAGTPDRVADMWVDEMFMGLDYDNFPKCTNVENKMSSREEFIIESGIQVNSVCEHHFVTIDGKATVAYVPKDKVLGLSKMNRIVDFFSRRPQIQERLTHQIAEALSFVAETHDVAVCINAVHYCVKARGVRDVHSTTCTFRGLGQFSDIKNPIRREFMERSRG